MDFIISIDGNLIVSDKLFRVSNDSLFVYSIGINDITIQSYTQLNSNTLNSPKMDQFAIYKERGTDDFDFFEVSSNSEDFTENNDEDYDWSLTRRFWGKESTPLFDAFNPDCGGSGIVEFHESYFFI